MTLTIPKLAADTIPAKYRKLVYAGVSIAAVLFGTWQASGGNWSVFAGSLITAATTGLAAGNTDTGVKAVEAAVADVVKPAAKEAGAVSAATAALVAIAVVLVLWFFGVHGHLG